MKPRIGLFLSLVAVSSACVYAAMFQQGGIHGPRFREWSSLLMWMPGLAALACLRLERADSSGVGWRPEPARYLLLAAAVPIALHAALLFLLWAGGAAIVPPEWLLSNLRRWARIPLIVPFTLGEELGWRAYLQPRLSRRLGSRAGIAAVGLVWGLWHAPLIWNGYNFPAHPRLGTLVLMPMICVGWAAFFGWLYARSRSIWVPTVAHASLNASFWMLAERPLVADPWTVWAAPLLWLVLGACFLRKVDS